MPYSLTAEMYDGWKKDEARLLGNHGPQPKGAAAVAERTALLATARKLADGSALFQIHADWYRAGERFPAGAIVALPAGELPSIYWRPITAADGNVVALAPGNHTLQCPLP